jgi:hypothetical protein
MCTSMIKSVSISDNNVFLSFKQQLNFFVILIYYMIFLDRIKFIIQRNLNNFIHLAFKTNEFTYYYE